MATCKKCGAEMENGQTICSQCGEPIENSSESQPAVADSKENLENEAPAQALEEENTGAQHAQEAFPQRGQPSPKAKKIAIIAACCAVLLFICGFAAKTYFARDLKMMMMGNGKYMQALEKTCTEAITDRAVGSLDMVMNQLPAKKNATAEEFKGSMHIDLDNSFKGQIKQQLGGHDEILNKTLDYINSITMEGSSNVNNQQMQGNVSFNDKSGKLVSVNMFMDKDGKYLVQLPEISKTYLSMENMQTANPAFAVSKVDYDSNKLKASLRALTQPYVEAVQNGKITVQKNQSLKVEDITVNNAAKISVTLSAGQMNRIMKKTLEVLKKDDYLCTYLSENYNAFFPNEKIDKEKFKEMIDAFAQQLGSDTDEKAALTVSAYVLADDTQVARSYEISEASAKVTLNLAFQKKQFAANVLADGKECFSAKLLYNTADSGVMQVLIKDKDKAQDAGLKIDFANAKMEKFANRDILLGTFTLSLYDPKGTVQNAIQSSLERNEWAKNLSKSTIKLENSIKNDQLLSNCTFDLKGLASIKMSTQSKPKTSNAITMPAVKENEVLKMVSSGTGEGQEELQKKYAGDFMAYLSEQLGKDKDLADLLQQVGINKTMVDFYRAQLK
ncbi:zinc ribbon domain-containing protein [Caproiciproducens galactitolivorans]|uniref:zinc ribbon domain-containing protein n=1 Tax=Caproiciproducens galactitolivorans TaxID=642589 RepID=UPI00240A02D9|nr:zinc ribbon domain-containing protein [Caproiciproducens galactitolivorans]